VVENPYGIDIGMIFGTGFPPFRGGLCRYADSEGLETIARTLHRFESKFGKRFKPTEYLTTHRSFY
jgi:3-hydroxyacyl-CoA dehydrogenase/enoyl-CoA hydratase/3-hydroxybutyryl-CoA epimerase